ncbi:MAG: type II secretion system F family protein [Minisyncoccia bacterium]|jgi:type II secretory pathway component PulF
MRFKYQAKTKEGETQVGFVEAGNRDGAVSILTGHDLFILSVEPEGKIGLIDRASALLNRVRRKDMIVFTRQLATLLEARVPLNNALKTLRDQTANRILKDVVARISEDIDAGLSFSQAMERQGETFPDFYVEMVRAAEVTGNMNEVTGFLADYTEKEGALVSKVVSALIYPAIVVALFIVVAFILVTFVFPSIGTVFSQNNVQLPWYTQALLAVGNFMAQWWVVVVIAAIVLAVVLADYLGTAEGKALLDDLKIRLPIAKKIYLPVIMARFGNAAALLVRGGIPIAQSLEIISHMVGNTLYKDIIHDIAGDVREGKLLSESIASHPGFFPTVVSQMVAVGETTGKTEEMFARVASIYMRETDLVSNNLVELIQPVLIVGMGIMVGLLFASILIPIYSLSVNIH